MTEAEQDILALDQETLTEDETARLHMALGDYIQPVDRGQTFSKRPVFGKPSGIPLELTEEQEDLMNAGVKARLAHIKPVEYKTSQRWKHSPVWLHEPGDVEPPSRVLTEAEAQSVSEMYLVERSEQLAALRTMDIDPRSKLGKAICKALDDVGVKYIPIEELLAQYEAKIARGES